VFSRLPLAEDSDRPQTRGNISRSATPRHRIQIHSVSHPGIEPSFTSEDRSQPCDKARARLSATLSKMAPAYLLRPSLSLDIASRLKYMTPIGFHAPHQLKYTGTLPILGHTVPIASFGITCKLDAWLPQGTRSPSQEAHG
jgi:hypothetical protein